MVLSLSANNITWPAAGSPLATPTQDRGLGSYYRTYSTEYLSQQDATKLDPRPKRFDSADVVELAVEAKSVKLQEAIEFARASTTSAGISPVGILMTAPSR